MQICSFYAEIKHFCCCCSGSQVFYFGISYRGHWGSAHLWPWCFGEGPVLTLPLLSTSARILERWGSVSSHSIVKDTMVNHQPKWLSYFEKQKLNVFLAGSYQEPLKTPIKGSFETNNSALHFCKAAHALDRGWNENVASKGQVGKKRKLTISCPEKLRQMSPKCGEGTGLATLTSQ